MDIQIGFKEPWKRGKDFPAMRESGSLIETKTFRWDQKPVKMHRKNHFFASVAKEWKGRRASFASVHLDCPLPFCSSPETTPSPGGLPSWSFHFQSMPRTTLLPTLRCFNIWDLIRRRCRRNAASTSRAAFPGLSDQQGLRDLFILSWASLPAACSETVKYTEQRRRQLVYSWAICRDCRECCGCGCGCGCGEHTSVFCSCDSDSFHATWNAVFF